MHAGKSYKLVEFLFWTRRNIVGPFLLSVVAAVSYQVFALKWLAIPFTIIGLLGPATAFIITFRNKETYNRSWEARQIWGATMSASRSWAVMCRNLVDEAGVARELSY
jgi:putative membrane protein